MGMNRRPIERADLMGPGSCDWATRSRYGAVSEGLVTGGASNPRERVEILLVGLGQRVQVLLRRLDLRMPHAVHDPFEVCSPG